MSVKKIISGICIPVVSGMVLVIIGCVKNVSDDNVKDETLVNVANCDECHTFPGTVMCKLDSLMNSSGVWATNCSECHSASVKSDSSKSGSSWKFHDKMVETMDGRFFPETDLAHANGKLDLVFNNCAKCHGNPPVNPSENMNKFDGHYQHVVLGGDRCYECHFNSIAHRDTTFFGNIIYKENEIITRSGDTVPVMIDSAHINNRVGVAFKMKYQKALTDSVGADSTFIWDSVEKSCRNVECHGNPGTSEYQKTFWSVN